MQGNTHSVFHWPLRIYWEDTDAGGIVFYAGVGQQQLRELTGGMFVVSDTQLRYHRPARLDDELIVTAQLQESGRASLTIGQQALLKPEHMTDTRPALLCEGTIRIGWVDAATMRPARMPGFLLEQLS